MSRAVITTSLLTSIANAIRAKTGKSAQLTPAQMATEIANIPTPQPGSHPGIDDDVLFIDYDGTLLYGYTAAQFNALSEMPANPSHTGLVAQGWNWTLADAKAYVAQTGKLVIGQLYTTDDGKTRLYISLDDRTGLTVYLNLRRTAAAAGRELVVDWGDGDTSTDTAASTTITNITLTHTYAVAGDYVVKLIPDADDDVVVGGQDRICLKEIENTYTNTPSYALKRVEVGANVKSISAYAFSYVKRLETVSIPATLSGTCGGQGTFRYSGVKCVVVPPCRTAAHQNTYECCVRMRLIAMPRGAVLNASSFKQDFALHRAHVQSLGGTYTLSECRALHCVTYTELTSLANYALADCSALPDLALPEGVTTIGSSALSGCRALKSLTLPASVTSIAAKAFENCWGLETLQVEATTPPSLAATTAFSGLNSLHEIRVPYSADHSILAAYKTATNWSQYSAYMVEEDPT